MTDEPIYFIIFTELCAYLKPGKIQILASKFTDFLKTMVKRDDGCILSRYMMQPIYINFILNEITCKTPNCCDIIVKHP